MIMMTETDALLRPLEGKNGWMERFTEKVNG